MEPKHTAAKLAALITNRIEPDNAEQVLAALKPHHGKLITTRLLDALPGGRVEWRLVREYGWTSIENRAYRSSRGSSPDGVNLMLTRTESSVALDVPWVERENPSYFAGRRERNAKRAAAIKDTSMLTRLAFTMNEIEDLQAKLAHARKVFDTFVKPSGPCNPDEYDLQRACGLRDDK